MLHLLWGRVSTDIFWNSSAQEICLFSSDWNNYFNTLKIERLYKEDNLKFLLYNFYLKQNSTSIWCIKANILVQIIRNNNIYFLKVSFDHRVSISLY